MIAEEAQPTEERHPEEIVAFEVAIKGKAVAYHDIVLAHRRMHSDEEDTRKLYAQYYPKLVDVFQEKYGEIDYLYVNPDNALVLTKKGYIFHEEKDPDLGSLELINRCDVLHTEAHRLLDIKSGLFSCMSMIVEPLSHLYGSLQKQRSDQRNEEKHKELIKHLKKQLGNLEADFVRCARRRARQVYTTSMFLGLLLVVLFSITLSTVLLVLNVATTTVALTLGSLSLGGIGAIISVMTRMSNTAKEEFPIDHDAGPEQNVRLGLYRPIIGATMGLILYFLMMSGLLPLEVPASGEARFFFVLIISFSAGFTERWAQDLLPGTKETTTPEAGTPGTAS